jgi:hypothetical protein
MVLSRSTRAVSASMLAIAATVLAWAAFAQAWTGRWSFHTTVEFAVLLTMPLTAAVILFCLPAFLLAGRGGNVNRMTSVFAGAFLSAVPAVILFGLFFSIDTARPQTVAEWTLYSALIPPFAISGAIFGLVWSRSGDSRMHS